MHIVGRNKLSGKGVQQHIPKTRPLLFVLQPCIYTSVYCSQDFMVNRVTNSPCTEVLCCCQGYQSIDQSVSLFQEQAHNKNKDRLKGINCTECLPGFIYELFIIDAINIVNNWPQMLSSGRAILKHVKAPSL